MADETSDDVTCLKVPYYDCVIFRSADDVFDGVCDDELGEDAIPLITVFRISLDDCFCFMIPQTQRAIQRSRQDVLSCDEMRC